MSYVPPKPALPPAAPTASANCRNCGAAPEPGALACAYCSTAYALTVDPDAIWDQPLETHVVAGSFLDLFWWI